MTTPTTSQEAPGATAGVAPVSLSQCATVGCLRRPEWRIAAVDHDGATIRAWLACHDSGHRGQASAAAWRVEPARVEIRQL